MTEANARVLVVNDTAESAGAPAEAQRSTRFTLYVPNPRTLRG